MSAGDKPFAGLRVVAVEQAVAAPLCSRHLAELGADVVKVERLDGDFARGYDSTVHGHSTYFVWLNGGKRSMAVDLRAPAGRSVLRRLVATADVLLANLGPGALERLLPASTRERDNPALVVCTLDGYGPTGPYADRKAFDLLIQGESGLSMSTGTEADPAKCGVPIADLAGGLYAFAAVSAALHARGVDGRGRWVRVSLLDALAEWMMPLLLAQAHSGRVPTRSGLHHAAIAPYGPYRTRDGAVVNIAVQNERQWRALCQDVVAAAELAADARFRSNEARVRWRDDLEVRVAMLVAELDEATLCTRLDAAGVPWGRLNNVADVLSHPQLDARGRWTEVDLPGGRSSRVVVSPLLSSPAEGRARVPGIGEHTNEILAELRFTTAEIQALAGQGIVATLGDTRGS